MSPTATPHPLVTLAAVRMHEAHHLAQGSPVLWAWADEETTAPFTASAQGLFEAGMLTDERPTTAPNEAPTLGEIADQLKPLKAAGVTRDSMLYVIDKVWWEEAGAANQARLAMADLVAAHRKDREQQ